MSDKSNDELLQDLIEQSRIKNQQRSEVLFHLDAALLSHDNDTLDCIRSIKRRKEERERDLQYQLIELLADYGKPPPIEYRYTKTGLPYQEQIQEFETPAHRYAPNPPPIPMQSEVNAERMFDTFNGMQH